MNVFKIVGIILLCTILSSCYSFNSPGSHYTGEITLSKYASTGVYYETVNGTNHYIVYAGETSQGILLGHYAVNNSKFRQIYGDIYWETIDKNKIGDVFYFWGHTWLITDKDPIKFNIRLKIVSSPNE